MSREIHNGADMSPTEDLCQNLQQFEKRALGKRVFSKKRVLINARMWKILQWNSLMSRGRFSSPADFEGISRVRMLCGMTSYLLSIKYYNSKLSLQDLIP